MAVKNEMRATLALVGVLIAATAAPALAGWENDVSPYDRQRLANLDRSRAEALAEAEAGGNRRDLAAIRGALGGPRGDISAAELKGTWRCRNLKVGGMTPTKVYAWFRCRVRQTRDGLFFEKLGGAWRVSGYLARYDGRGWVLLGAISNGNERQVPYSGGTQGGGSPVTSNDAVGVVTRAGRGRARIEFPEPIVESRFDILELRR
jgi:hypothetical protein